MLKDVLFSVVITLYNKEKYIYDTLLSVCSQTYKNFEIIIVNDGSTDSSLYEVFKIKDTRIKLFNTVNKGVSNARNFGVKKAKGSYIAFLDGDDLWKENHLERANKMIKQYPSEFVYASATVLKKNQKIKECEYSVLDKDIQLIDYFEGSLKQSVLSASSIIIREDAYDELGGFDVRYTNYEDIDFWFRIGLRYKVVFSIQTTVVVRLTKNSLSRTKVDLERCCFFETYDSVKNRNKAFYNVLELNKYSLALLCKEYRNDEKFKETLSRIDESVLSLRQKYTLSAPVFLIKCFKKTLF